MAFATRPALVASDFLKKEIKDKKPEEKKKKVVQKKKKPAVKKVAKKVVPAKKFVGRTLPWN